MTFAAPRFLRAVVLTACLLSIIQFPVPEATGAGRTCMGQRATMVGTGRRDRLIGTEGRDVVFAGGGNDLIFTGPGEDIICSGSGNDGINASADNDRVLGQGGNDLVLGGPGDDFVNGGGGNDLLMGMRDDDKLLGGGGKYDVVSYYFKCYGGDSPCRGVSVDLRSGRAEGEGRDKLGSIEAIEASDGADALRGDNGRNIFWTFGDRDRVRAMGGRDVLVGGKSGKPGYQSLFGGSGKDLILALGSYSTSAFGGGDNDRIFFRRSFYRGVGYGGGGNDVLVGRKTMADLLFGDAGDDRLYGRGGEDGLLGLGGDDLLVGGPQNDEVRGGAGDDLMSGDPGADVFDMPRGRTAPYKVHGGIDTLSYEGSPEPVSVNLEAGTSEPQGWGGDQFPIDAPFEVLIGSDLGDQLTGSSMADGLFGGEGSDHLYGLDGDDTLDGEDGTDTADGGNGEDECEAETRTGCEGIDILPIDPPPLPDLPPLAETRSLDMPSLRFADLLQSLTRHLTWRP